jgi:hypothetical protein
MGKHQADLRIVPDSIEPELFVVTWCGHESGSIPVIGTKKAHAYWTGSTQSVGSRSRR